MSTPITPCWMVENRVFLSIQDAQDFLYQKAFLNSDSYCWAVLDTSATAQGKYE